MNIKALRDTVFLLAAISSSQTGFADDPRVAATSGRWGGGDSPEVFINVSDLISPSQREIVNSGFSTFTLFAVSSSKITDQDALPDLRNVCSVKYDTWEEKYQLLRIEPPPVKTQLAKDYKAWADDCLSLTVKNPEVIRQLTGGGTLFGVFQIRQSSPDEAQRIKNWLVKQQSGFMQGLYAHMLGDFQFKGTVSVTITIPPRPLTSSGEGASKSQHEKKGI